MQSFSNTWAHKCCDGPLSVQTHTADRRQSQSHGNGASQSGQCHLKKLRARWFKPPVNANCSVSMPTTRLNFSATSHPVRPSIYEKWRVPAHRPPSQRGHKKSATTTQIVASHSDTFGVHDNPAPAPCANNRTTLDGHICPSSDACKCALLSSTFC